MRVLRVNDLANELDFLPGEMGIMLTLGQMAGWAQQIVVGDSVSSLQISSHIEGVFTQLEREKLRKTLEDVIRLYCDTREHSKINAADLADLCIEIIEMHPPIA